MSKKAKVEMKPHRDPGEHDLPCVPVTKAYRNSDFLNSSHARHIRILCEYEETMQRLRTVGVRATVMFFGSARSKDHTMHARAVEKTKAKIAAATPGSEEAKEAEQALARLASIEWMCDYMDKIRQLSRRVTQWSVNRAAKPLHLVSGVARGARSKRMREERMEGDKSESEPEGGGPVGLARKVTVYKPHSSDVRAHARATSARALPATASATSSAPLLRCCCVAAAPLLASRLPARPPADRLPSLGFFPLCLASGRHP